MRFLHQVNRAKILSVGLLTLAVGAQERPRIFKDHVMPHWFAGNTKFWYENELPGGAKEFVVVDAERGVREQVASRPEAESQQEGLTAESEIRPSTRNGPETKLTFDNRRSNPLELIWIDTAGERHSYGTVGGLDRRELN